MQLSQIDKNRNGYVKEVNVFVLGKKTDILVIPMQEKMCQML